MAAGARRCLRDGVDSFGTSTHEWMRANAPLFGWFHPAWPQQGGSKPEAWHRGFSPELAADVGLMLSAPPLLEGPT